MESLRVFVLERIEREWRDVPINGVICWIERGWRGGNPCLPCNGVISLNWVSYVYPPLGGLLFLAGNPYMIFDVYITIVMVVINT